MEVLLHPSDQPVFRLSLRSSQCILEVRVNDVPVFGDVSGSALSLDLPVNEWLFQGGNEIRVLISPLEDGAPFGEQARLELVLIHKFARDAARNATEIGVLRWQPKREPVHTHGPGHDAGHAEATTLDEHDEDAPLLALPGQPEELAWRIGEPEILANKSVRIATRLLLPPPWTACPWTRSQPLAGDASILAAVQGLLRVFHQRLKGGGYDDFLKWRRAAIEGAYYLNSTDSDAALGFPSLLRHKDWRLEALPEKGVRTEVAGYGRLVRILNEATGESPLVLVNQEAGVSVVVDAWWMFDGEWKLIR